MPEVVRGKIIWKQVKAGKQRKVVRADRPTVEFFVNDEHFAPSLADALKAQTEIEVGMELESGQPRRIRPVGEAWQGAAVPPPRVQPPPQRRDEPQRGRRSEPPSHSLPGEFHNPYNFIPTPRRDEIPKTNELRDRPPHGHHRYFPEAYSGWIDVTVETKTPLLIPDTSCPTVYKEGPQKGHKVFETLLGPDGRPYLHPAGIRGALRAAYEAITNSRYGVFSKNHDAPHGYRMDARDGVTVIPARIDNGRIHLLTGASVIQNDGRPDGPLYAAWLPRYNRDGQVASWAVRYADGQLPQHSEAVECWLELFQHHRWDRNRNRHVPDFQYWSVRALVRDGTEVLGGAPVSSRHRERRDRQSWHEPLGRPMKRVRGWVCVTNANINRKHDERVFFVEPTVRNVAPVPVTNEHRRVWRDLIANYQSLHEDDLKKRDERNIAPDAYLGPEPGKTAFSRHVYTLSDELSNGTLCYAHVEPAGSTYRIVALYPVNISRKIHPDAPKALLDDSLQPAPRLKELSPADRVFGWVRGQREKREEENPKQDEPAAYRGQLRISSVHCESENAIESWNGESVPLAILGAPKPQQVRFYVGNKDDECSPLRPNIEKPQYTQGDKALRGRKVYPRDPKLSTDYWKNPAENRTEKLDAQGRFQEYRKPPGKDERTDQNRSMREWVKIGTTFTFRLRVRNLSAVELGALLWLLSLPEDHHLRFGGGKPLGFGCVRLSIKAMRLRNGEQIKDDYAHAFGDKDRTNTRSVYLDSEPAPEGSKKVADLIGAYKTAVLEAYPAKTFEEVPFIAAFLVAAKGFGDGLPVHYPRVRTQQDNRPVPPQPEGENFKWFGENERSNRLSLPSLVKEGGLPYYLVTRR